MTFKVQRSGTKIKNKDSPHHWQILRKTMQEHMKHC